MEGINFIQDLAIVLLGAGIAGSLCKRIGLSVIVGYLVAGIIIGPYTPPFSLVLDIQRIETLAQIGLVFLMFSIGLGLSLTNLRRMGASTLLATALGALFVYNLTRLFGYLADWPQQQSLFVAAMLMVSSSAVIAKVIRDMNLGHERAGQLALGVTVLEDIVAVVMLAVLGAQLDVSGSGELEIGGLLLSLVAFVVILVLAGLSIIPKLLRRFDTRADRELQTIIVAGVLLLAALLAVKAGYSLALGAFLLGAVVAELPQKSGVEKSFGGLRDMFSSVFFVAIGMMIDVRLMLDVWPWIIGLGVFTLVARSVSTGLALILLGNPPHQARQAGLALMPLGEFTFVIAQLGVASQVLPAEFYPIAVGVSIFTVLLSPLINRHAAPVLAFIEASEPRWLSRGLRVYHSWLDQLGSLYSGKDWWQMGRRHLVQIVLELLVLTGLLLFAERLLQAFRAGSLASATSPAQSSLIFWSMIGLIALIPLVALWRNFNALATLFASAAASRTRLPGPVVENGFRALSTVGLAFWLSLFLPAVSLSPNWWLALGAALLLILLIFSRRLLYWHGRWQESLREVLAEAPPTESTRHWLESSDQWGISIQELVIPEGARCAGRSIAELAIRSRFGCSVVEIDRQGHTIVAPEPSQRLYSGDRLLLLGTAAQIGAAREGLSNLGELAEPVFDQARLESFKLPDGPHIGQTLIALQIPRHTGVLVTAIRRGTQIIVNPRGVERLASGDELLILGAPEQIRTLRAWLADDAGDEGQGGPIPLPE